MTTPFVIHAAVEGDLDAAVAAAMIRHTGAEPGPVFGLKGKPFLRKRIAAWNAGARWQPWLVFFDLDDLEICPVQEVEDWLPRRSLGLCLRIAIPSVEAWLLADQDGMARFLGVAPSLLPLQPERVPDPKAFLVKLARKSRKKTIRDGLVPRPNASRKVGATYTSELMGFALNSWSLDRAAASSDSLARGLRCLQRLGDFEPPASDS